MSLFSKKPPAAPPVLPAPPPLKPKTETILKLDLPDVFAFHGDATKAKTAARQMPGTVEESKPTTRRGVVVLVESDDEVRRLISRLLQYEGFQLQTVTCLAEARELLKETTADFVLARRACVPLNLQTEIALREIRKKASVRIVDEFNELILGQVVDYESLAQCTQALGALLLSLIEGANPGARGHAHTVAKYCRLVGQRLGMKRRDLDGLTLAATLHDLGSLETEQKISEPAIKANEVVSPSLRPTLDLLANVPFPYEVNELLSAATDVVVAGTETENAELPPTPLGARILRVVDTYDTLRRGRTEEFPEEDKLFEWMRRQPTGTFDTDALETLIHIRKHERAINAMNLFSAVVLLADPHPEELALLKLRLENDDFQVAVARTLEEAVALLRQQSIALILTEYDLGGRGGGFGLLRTVKADPTLRHIPVVIHAPANTDLTKQALEIGAEDWYPKPGNTEIAALKLGRILERRHAALASTDGVQGNLRDLGLVEMVQIMCAGARSVHISIENDGQQGELAIRQGQIVHARLGETEGETAALALLGWRAGNFRLRPLKGTPPITITGSTDALLAQRCAQDKAKPHPTDNRTNPQP